MTMASMASFALNQRQQDNNGGGGGKTWAYEAAQLTRSLKINVKLIAIFNLPK